MMAGAYRTPTVRPTRPPGSAVGLALGFLLLPFAQDPELIAGAEPSGALNGMAKEVRERLTRALAAASAG